MSRISHGQQLLELTISSSINNYKNIEIYLIYS